ncbi:MAG: hypothetical protein ACD_58C00036G0001 [uncultured bacterium]|nr:MAG: hypothetical protein ACD_58C00036G0001 [uncultured bacterium]
MRYGDDFIILDKDLAKLEEIRENTIRFIENSLLLKINLKNDIIVKARRGIKFLGVVIYPDKRSLNKRNLKRIKSRLNINNASSYYGLIKQHSKHKLNEFSWEIMEVLDDE